MRDIGLRRYFSNTFGMMGLGLLITALVSHLVLSNATLMSYLITGTGAETAPSPIWYVAIVGEFALVIWMASWTAGGTVSFGWGAFIFGLYAALNGLTLAPVLDLYTQASVVKVFCITAATFGACALYGHTTKRNLLPMGTFFLMGLFGLIIVMAVNLFLRSPMMDFVVSGAGVLLFAGLTAYDMQKLEDMYESQGESIGLVVYGALTLYLDFLNLLLFILRFVGVRKD
jgi:FtsH-binding integral membrane protein